MKVNVSGSKTMVELARSVTQQVRDAGMATSQKKVKEALAQAYGFHCYNACYYDCNGRIPRTAFIPATFWRVLGYPNGDEA